ncbi:hypothetical protein SAMN05446635_5949 [Burkholderia sp. OK233]|nr:hypothetical protein SAMN05446635_5949 [Burkholderia sp. OK233]
MSCTGRTGKKAAAESRARALWMFEGTVTEREWVDAPYLSAADTRRIVVAELCPSLESVVMNVWSDEVPASEHPTIVRQVKSGVRHGCSELLREVNEAREVAMGRVLFALPPYWEPPAAQTEPQWPLHQLRAFRWSAAVIAYAVRNAVEPLHTRYTSDESMPPLNRGIRNTVYVTRLRRPEVGLRLSGLPRAFIEEHSRTGVRIQLPCVVG